MKSKVAIVKTSPETVLEDYRRLLNLAGYQDTVDKTVDTALKVNISWHFFYPACSAPQRLFLEHRQPRYRRAHAAGNQRLGCPVQLVVGRRRNSGQLVGQKHTRRLGHRDDRATARYCAEPVSAARWRQEELRRHGQLCFLASTTAASSV